MEKINKKLIFSSIFVILIIGIGVYFGYLWEKERFYKKYLSEKDGVFILDYGNGQKRYFLGEVVEGMTVRETILAASLAGNFDFENDTKLIRIDDFSNNSKKWKCYLNSKLIEGNLNKIPIKPNDKVYCKYN